MGNIDLLIGMLIEKRRNRDVNKNPIMIPTLISKIFFHNTYDSFGF